MSNQPISEADKEKFRIIWKEHSPQTDPAFYALYCLASHWVETEILIEKSAQEEVERSGSKWTPQDEDGWGELAAERTLIRDMHDTVLLPIQRYSCIAMLYTTVERELKRIIELLEKEHGKQKLTIGEIKGDYLTQVAKYLEVFFNIRIQDCPQYDAMQDLRKVRNCIIHYNGDVALSSDKEYLINGIKRKGFLAHISMDLKIDKQCIQQFTLETWQFFFWLFSQLRWRVNILYINDRLTPLFEKLGKD